MKQVGLFFGSFNPIHIGHLAIANYLYSYTELEEIWMVISPHNPLKTKASLLNHSQRLYMVNVAIEDSPFLKASSIEFDLPQPSYTVNTLAHLKEIYPNITFSLIMGSDNLNSFHKWKNFEHILDNYKIFVYPRPGEIPLNYVNHPNIVITKAPQMDISSSFIRNAIKEKKNIQYFLTPTVWNFIDEMNLYKQ
jgi:nicotinate-nucleotide adenylyltransferase